MWAYGCVSCELISKRPLFPGSDSINQIQVISSILGPPGPEILSKIADDKVKDLRLILNIVKICI